MGSTDPYRQPSNPAPPAPAFARGPRPWLAGAFLLPCAVLCGLLLGYQSRLSENLAVAAIVCALAGVVVFGKWLWERVARWWVRREIVRIERRFGLTSAPDTTALVGNRRVRGDDYRQGPLHTRLATGDDPPPASDARSTPCEIDPPRDVQTPARD